MGRTTTFQLVWYLLQTMDSYAMFIYTDQMLPYDDAVLRCITTNRSRLLTEEVISALHSDLLRKSSWFYSQTYQLSGSCKGKCLQVETRRVVNATATNAICRTGQTSPNGEFIVIETNTSDSAPCLPQGFLSPVAMSDVTSLYGAGLLIPNKAYLIGMFLPTDGVNRLCGFEYPQFRGRGSTRAVNCTEPRSFVCTDEIPMFTEMTISEGGDTSTKSETTEVSAHVSLQVSSTTAQSSLSPNDTSPGSESPDNGGILGIGLLVGLVIGAAVITVIIVGVVIFIVRRHGRKDVQQNLYLDVSQGNREEHYYARTLPSIAKITHVKDPSETSSPHNFGQGPNVRYLNVDKENENCNTRKNAAGQSIHSYIYLEADPPQNEYDYVYDTNG